MDFGACHDALMCQDVLEEIGRCLLAEEDRWTAATSLNLACLARVCKVFNVSFNKMLWAKLPSIVPLLRLLSWVSCAPHDDDEITKIYVLSGPVDLDNWSRFLCLASMVRKLESEAYRTVDPDTSCTVSPSVWKTMAMLSEGKPLLPSLQHYYWRDDPDQPADSMLLEVSLFVASPSLRKLSLAFRGRQSLDTMAQAFQTIFSSSPALSVLDVRALPSHQQTLSPTIIPVGMLGRLSKLKLPAFPMPDLDMFRTLSSMEALSELTIGASFGYDFSPDVSGFPSLIYLQLLRPCPDTVLTVISAIASHKLLRLDVQCARFSGDRPWICEDLSALFTVLAQRFPLLQELHVDVVTVTLQSVDFVTTSLMSLLSLKRISLAFRDDYMKWHRKALMTDTFFSAFAAWQSLVSFGFITPLALDHSITVQPQRCW
ncbi:hypothetical protein K466DRAFT_269609 [Polyporus arcularius HHB13444]|uniref:F-box domain-containing protein n=1 Tax=Polyporus arcularius HHB13444 TaxID=1314778 RepID=A0A5C3PQF0_9APHY|nr:hypothetical protein K466DRAFT_269609 [Polyporus arcularius HHB13444]